MAQANKTCQKCGQLGHSKFYCRNVPRKPISQRGKEAKRWDLFRDKVAKPFLDNKFGHICNFEGCSETKNLDVDHIKTRGAHHELKYDVKNMQYLCRYHHSLKTDGKLSKDDYEETTD